MQIRDLSLAFNLNNTLLMEKVVDQISEFIHQKQFVGGEKIPNEYELSQLFKVGRGTVREAVKILISKNILEIRRGKGTYVCEKPGMATDPFGFFYTDNKIQLISDLITIRCILEPEISFLAAQYAKSPEIEQLQMIADIIDNKVRAKQEFCDEDILFHTVLAKCSKNMVMPDLIPVISYGINLYNHKLKSFETLQAVQIHHEIIQAVERHDPERAKSAMLKHLQYNKKNIDLLLEQQIQA